MKHELNIPEAVVHAAATILQQYVPEITPRYLKAAILQYHSTGDAAETKAIVKRKLTRTECCQILDISQTTLHRYIHAGYLKTVKIGPRLIRIDPESVQNLLDNGVPVETEQNQ